MGQTARIWQVASGRSARLASREGEFQSAAFSPDGTRIVTVNGGVLIWDAASRREIATLKGHAGMVFSAAFSADGKQVVTGSQDKTARIWDVSAIPKGNILVVACASMPKRNWTVWPGPDPAPIGDER
jgi:WD40 repeat protein